MALPCRDTLLAWHLTSIRASCIARPVLGVTRQACLYALGSPDVSQIPVFCKPGKTHSDERDSSIPNKSRNAAITTTTCIDIIVLFFLFGPHILVKDVVHTGQPMLDEICGRGWGARQMGCSRGLLQRGQLASAPLDHPLHSPSVGDRASCRCAHAQRSGSRHVPGVRAVSRDFKQ